MRLYNTARRTYVDLNANQLEANVMVPTLLRYADLQRRNVVKNWQTLSNWIEKENFPPGRLIGPNTRVWTEEEVTEWISSRPTALKVTPVTEAHISRQHRRSA